MTSISLPIRLKIPAVVIGLGLLTAVVIVTLAFATVRTMALDTARRQIERISVSKADAVKLWLQGVASDTVSIAANPTVAKSVGQLKSSLLELGPDPLATLRDVYVTRNPHPATEYFKLEKPEEKGGYHFRHSTLQRYFTTVIDETGFADVLLISPKGDVLYAYAKAADFATNLVTGPNAQSELGRAFRAAIGTRPGTASLSDFAPYAPSNNAPAMFVAAPIKDAYDTVVGVLAMRATSDRLDAILAEASELGPLGQAYLIGPDGRARSTLALGEIALNQPVLPLPFLTDSGRADGVLVEDTPLQSGGSGLAMTQTINTSGLDWMLSVERESRDILAEPYRFLWRVVLFSAVVLAIIAGIGLWLAGSISRPIVRLSGTLSRIGAGDLECDVPDRSRNDEVGSMARALEILRGTLADARAQDAAQAAAQAGRDSAVEALRAALLQLSEGNLTKHIDTPFPGELDSLRHDFNRAIAQMSRTIADVVASANSIRSDAGVVGSSAADLSRRTEAQAATLEETAAALDQLTQSVRSAAEAARKVEGIVLDARHEADQSAAVVDSAVAAMTGIETSASHISQIIGVIDDIAFQTNLLALNAGVEAARAGDAGKGFAVVASEVRSLAQRSSTAAKEIKTLIATSGQQVQIGVARVGETGLALTRIAERVQEIAGQISGIAAASAEQSAGLGEINTGMIQLDTVTQQNAAMAGEVETASQSMSLSADALQQQVARFRIRDTAAKGREPAVSKPAPHLSVAASRLAEPPARPKATATARNAGSAALAQWEDF